MYSTKTSLLLLAMILTGAFRIEGVKLYYQLWNFDKPYFIATMYHLAGLPFLLYYYLVKKKKKKKKRRRLCQQQCCCCCCPNKKKNSQTLPIVVERDIEEDAEGGTVRLQNVEPAGHGRDEGDNAVLQDDKRLKPQSAVASATSPATTGIASRREFTRTMTIGSCSGITDESHVVASSILHHIRPPWLALVLIGYLNIQSYLLRFGALLYIPASIVEMLSNGLELLLTVLLSRYVRKRQISFMRWIGVLLVFIGLLVVGIGNIYGGRRRSSISNSNSNEKGDDFTSTTTSSSSSSSSSVRGTVMGLSLVVGTGITMAILVMLEELLQQEGDHKYDACVITGTESFYGIVIALLLYVPLAPIFDKNDDKDNEGDDDSDGGNDSGIATAWKILKDTKGMIPYSILFLVISSFAGIFSILSIRMTSCMTRSIWQYFRAVPLWCIELFLFYYTKLERNNNDGRLLGEPWNTKYSMIVLLGFLLMVVGVYTYYHHHEHREEDVDVVVPAANIRQVAPQENPTTTASTTTLTSIKGNVDDNCAIQVAKVVTSPNLPHPPNTATGEYRWIANSPAPGYYYYYY